MSVFMDHWYHLASLDKTAIIDAHGAHSFLDLDGLANVYAATLLKGQSSLASQRIGLFAEPTARFVAAFIGIIKAGGCVMPLSPLHTPPEIQYFCTDAEVRAVLCPLPWAEQLRPVFPPSTELHSLAYENGSPRLQHPPHVSALPDSAPALQLYTSGTTGKPKGVVLSQSNLLTQQILLREAWGIHRGDTLLHTLPLHHIHGLCIALLSVLGAGGTVAFLPRFDATLVWEKMRECSLFMAVPTLYAKLFAAFDQAQPHTQAQWKHNASQLRLATSGSAALPVGLAKRWQDLTGKIPLERYGMTEIGVALSNPLLEERERGAVGIPLPTVKTLILKNEGENAREEDGNLSEVGELWVGGPSVFSEYYRRPAETADAFLLKDGIRYFRTGDTVARDARGFYRILGRTSVDILKTGGYKVSAVEIEEALREHPDVDEATVLGLPDPVWGDRVIACLVLKNQQPKGAPEKNQEPSEESFRIFLKSKLASYKIPKRILFLSHIPKNALGKVIKKELAASLENQV